jgi:hypothetical protein
MIPAGRDVLALRQIDPAQTPPSVVMRGGAYGAALSTMGRPRTRLRANTRSLPDRAAKQAPARCFPAILPQVNDRIFLSVAVRSG